MRRLRRLAASMLLIGLSAQPAAAQTATVETATYLRQMLEALGENGSLLVEQSPIGAASLMSAFYRARQFRPAWTDAKDVSDLIAGIESAPRDGLAPEDFHLSAVYRLRSADGLDPAQMAGRDLLFTDALVRLGYQLYYGKLDPSSLDANWNLDRPLFDRNPAEVVADALERDAIPAVLSSLRPQTVAYGKLRAELARQRDASRRPQMPVSEGPTLHKGDRGPRVAALRSRLGLSADAAFDDAVEDAVRAFQDTHRLTVDGVVGARTLAVLNVGPEQRIETLRVNLERARWFRDLEESGTFIAVNIAGYRIYLVRHSSIAWQSRAIVGKTYHKTPLFTADMQYVVLNPTWTPTARIVRNEMVPRIRRDPGYLTARGFVVYDSSGRRVDPHLADWSAYWRYRIVQQPGEQNALGRVKFIFPNGHSVYLHDTPSRDLFGERRRAFSHGCIRVENPIELAKRLIADNPAWSPEAIDAAIASGKTKTVYLSKPFPVYLLYWTANPIGTGDGVIEYLPDVYDRDRAILEALNAPFKPIVL